MIKHIHLPTCDSTQDYIKLLKKAKSDRDILVSCDQQLKGYGRKLNSWQQFPNSLAMSFTLEPSEILSLTPLEVGIIISDFFKKFFEIDLFLKWPNDLFTQNKEKVGGIIMQNSDFLYVGLGVNLGDIPESQVKKIESSYHVGSINLNKEFHLQSLSLQIYQYILHNRIKSMDSLYYRWNKLCLHKNQKVAIEDKDFKIVGIFKGIGKDGEAIIQSESSISKIYSGSLTFI